MGLVGVFLYFLTSKIIKKDNLPLKKDIEATNKKLVASFKYWKINPILKNNSNVKAIIIRLFYISWIIDFVLFSLTIFIILSCFGGSYLWRFIGYHQDEIDAGGLNISWIAIVCMNIVFLMALIRLSSDSLKLSFRGSYQKKYMSLLILDIITLNLLSSIGIIIYAATKSPIIGNYKRNTKLDFKDAKIKEYFSLIKKIEIITFIIFLMLFSFFLIVGHFVTNNSLKYICFGGTLIFMVSIYAWSISRIVGIFILNTLIKNFILNNNYDAFLTLVRLLVYIFGYYYLSVLINLFNLDDENKEIILEDW